MIGKIFLRILVNLRPNESAGAGNEEERKGGKLGENEIQDVTFFV